MATNPVVSLPDSEKIRRALKKCPLVVVSDCMADTDTTRLADVLLPAQGWSEKSGTVTNSERRISRQRRILPTPGLGKADWWIISEVAKRLGFGSAFNYAHEGKIFDEYVKMTALGNREGKYRALNLIGLADLSAEAYNKLTPQQWPVIEHQKQLVNQRMFADNVFFTANKKAQLIPVLHLQPASACSVKYPLVLNSGRIRDQWHSMTRTGLSSRLSAHIPEPSVSINPVDAHKKQLITGNLINLSSVTGNLLVRLNVSSDVKQGQLFMPIHWNQTTAKNANICALIKANPDTVSGQPEFKFTPVAVEKFCYKSEAWLLSRTLIDVDEFAYWVKQKVAGGYLYRLADTVTPIELMIKLSNLMLNNAGRNLSFTANSGSIEPIYRYAKIDQQKMQQAYIVGKNLQQQELDWLQSLLNETIDSSVERSIISGKVEGKLAGGKIICACKQVGQKTIENAITEHQLNSQQAVASCTGAGTGCGSCISEIEQILEDCGAYSIAQ